MGNEISKALEEDVLQVVNGVVAEKLLVAKGDGSTVRRSAKDIAQRQQIFAFCPDWDLRRLSDFLRWYSRYQSRQIPTNDVKYLDLRGLDDQVDALERDVTVKQQLLQQVEQELKSLSSDEEDSEEKRLLRETLENRRGELKTSLRDQHRALRDRKVHLLASIDGVDLSAEVKWPVFMKAVSRVHFHTALETNAEAFSSQHPAAAGYAMKRDDQAKGTLSEYTKGDILMPPPANHEIDGHTDDSASSSAASEEDASDADEASDGDAVDGEEGAGIVMEENAVLTKKQPQGGDEDDENEEEDEDEEETGTEVPPSPTREPINAVEQREVGELNTRNLEIHDKTVEEKAEANPTVPYKELVNRPRVIKRLVPELFDASTRSPIFFGYTLEKRANDVEEAITEDDELLMKENSIFENKIKNRRDRLDESLINERGKLDVLKQREADMKQKRDRYWEKRQAEFERAKKELDPNDIFFRTREVQDKKTRDTQAFEDEELRRQREKIEARMQSAQEEFDQGMTQIRQVRATDEPLGEIRLKFHEAEVDHYHDEMLIARTALSTAKDEYTALKSSTTIRIGSQETKNRAQLLYAEDQIRARERELEAVCAMYDNELFLLKRAQDAFNREQMFLPFFACMQRDQPTSAGERSTINAKRFSVLEMSIALLVGLGGVSIRSKIDFVFKMFSKPGSSRKHSVAAGIQVIQREAFAEILRLFLFILAKLGDFRPRQRFDRDVLLGIVDREFLKLDIIVESENIGSPRNGMTVCEFEMYCMAAVEKSKYLSDLLGAPWRYDQLSRFVVQHMSAVQQYKLGLINVNDLKFTIARQSITTRPELSRWKKEVIHERALAMGENDPLKTDYSKYLPKRRSKLLSKVVPLDHGGYRNLLHYRMEVILRATIKLQTAWRARKGRQLARLAAEKQAFYHARGVALQEARDKVETEWREKDEKPAHTVEKMKFEAKIRMKQVRLRTNGNAFSREQVFALLMEEAVQQAQKEVESRFREMEEELGYLKHDESLVKPFNDFDYLKDDISKALVAQVVHAKQETEDVAAVMDAIILTEELEKKKKKQAKSTQQQSSANNQESKPSVPEVANENDTEQHFENADDKARRLERTRDRQENMIYGRFPTELYRSGLTREDHLFKMSQAFPDPPLMDLRQRLQRVCAGMTEFKLGEMLQELPSKRHICAYANSFRRHDGTYDTDRLEIDLLDHFRMVRGAPELAAALIGFVECDLEFGETRKLLSMIQEENDHALIELMGTESARVAEENAMIMNKKLVRMGFKTPGLNEPGEDEELQGNPLSVLQQKEQHELNEKKKRMNEAHSRFLVAMRLWKEAELSFQETQKSQLKVQAKYPVLAAHRTKWAERLSNALCLQESDAKLLQHKYTEVLNVCQDFIDTSTVIAKVLVREFHLPVSQKTILPVRDTTIDGRKDDVRTTIRFKYEAHSIVFKFCTDDHGRFENSDEYAAKYGGHEVRNSSLYHRALLSQVNSVLLPLQCVVDFQGYRVLCCSKLPIEHITWNEAGTSIQKITKQLVHGTENHGKTIILQSKELDNMLKEVASRLNLNRHGVRGYHDLTSKMLHAPADLLGYINGEKRFVLVNFARVMPPEDPEVTPHLCNSTRGMSIVWRQLRPELVASYKAPLSSDALSSMTYGTPDWQAQALGVEEATQHLIDVVIPGFARKLSQKTNYFSAQTFCLTSELHRHGINVRHLGLLRKQFPVALSGTATLQYSTAEIQTTEDFTREVDRGAPLFIQAKAYFVSRSTKHRYDAQCITLNEVYMGNSIQHVTVYAGRQDCLQNAQTIRDHLLAEMVARTFKNIVRHLLRTAAKLSGTGLTVGLYRRILVHCLNLLTGSERGSEDEFWKVHLYEGMRVRFGPRSVSEVDQQNMRRKLLPHMARIVKRVSAMMGVQLRPSSIERLDRLPDCYTFVLEDLEAGMAFGSDGPFRVKHNLSVLHFSMASLLLLQATVKQATSYKQLVLSDEPSGYWPLCERRGLSTASNLGSYGKKLVGRYLAACVLEAEGPIVNTDLNRATRFRKESRSYVAFPVVPELYPRDTETHIGLEVWCKCDGHASTRRVVLTIGRFTLSALKANVWAFSFNVRNIDILAFGAQVELHKWTHLVGTYDGTMLRLFVDGFLQNEVDVESVIDSEIAKREAVIAKTRQDITDMEEEARGKCFKEVDQEMQQYFLSKDGKKQIKAVSQKLLDEHEFRVRLSKAATAAPKSPSNDAPGDNNVQNGKSKTGAPPPASSKRDLSRVTRTDFEPLAKKQLLREKFEERVKVVVVEFKEMRQRVNDKIAREMAEQSDQDARELRIGCLSSASRRDGKYFFHGCIAHVAYYNGRILTRDQVNAHYVMGVKDRAHISDDLFALASSRFTRTLAYAPDDKRTLERFGENICASLKYDLDHQHAQAMYKKKVKCGLDPFIATENAHGIAEILKNLPRDPAFSDLFVYCYHALLKIKPDYFHATLSDACRLDLRELGRMPFQFFLGSRSANSLVNVEREEAEIPVFADIIKKVLADYPTFYGDQLTDMRWLRGLQNEKAIVYFILSMEGGEDVRYINMNDVRDIGNEDMDVIVKNNRFAMGFILEHCSLLNDLSIMRLALCCSQIEVLDLSYCSLLTDAAMVSIAKHCVRLRKLWLIHCHQISDLGVEASVKPNPRLEELGLSYCERISERCMSTIGSSCPNLAVLELELCVQIGSPALRMLASALVNPAKLRKLNLAGCHRIADDGLHEIAETCTRLQDVNVRLCDKLTDASLCPLTHNNLLLEIFNIEEVVHATHRIFQFDQEGDGRGVVEKNLVKKLQRLTLTGCTGVNDLAIGYVGHRCKQIKSLALSACTEITDQGIHWLLIEDMLDKSTCADEIEHLDISYCPQLSSSGIHGVVLKHPTLTSLNLSGCIHLSDDNLIDIINACTKLVRLEVAFCRELTDAVLYAIAKHLSLELLNVGRCIKITDDGMREVAGQLSVLKQLNVSACKKLSDKTLLGLLEACDLLEEIDVTHCPNFSGEVLARFVRRKIKIVSAKVLEFCDVEKQSEGWPSQVLGIEDSPRNNEEIEERQRDADTENVGRGKMWKPSGKAAVVEAIKVTRTTRLPGSDTNLPPIHPRANANGTR